VNRQKKRADDGSLKNKRKGRFDGGRLRFQKEAVSHFCPILCAGVILSRAKILPQIFCYLKFKGEPFKAEKRFGSKCQSGK
ncbi:MAG: hypothetical protein M1282_01340, partial [Chloroflexi bacterium]|nr:hypothetical protein [Chloroflexota bacterium]